MFGVGLVGDVVGLVVVGWCVIVGFGVVVVVGE